MKEKFERLFGHLVGRTNVKVVVAALLPRGRDSGLERKLRDVNGWLEGSCREKGWVFLSLWERFYGMDWMYKRDLLHPNWVGTRCMSREFVRVLSEIQGEAFGEGILGKVVGEEVPLN